MQASGHDPVSGWDAVPDMALSGKAQAMKSWMSVFAVLLAASPAWAQSGNGIDYFNSSEAQVTALKQQLAGSQQMLLWQQQQAMRNVMAAPEAQAMYQQYRARGGMMPYPQFAEQYALTGGFTPEGKRRAAIARDQINARDQQSWQSAQAAEAARAAAMRNQQIGFGRNQVESGNHLSGTSSWANPATGMTYQLPHATPNTPIQDPRTGQYFQMDARGNYHVSTPQGTWAPMTPHQ